MSCDSGFAIVVGMTVFGIVAICALVWYGVRIEEIIAAKRERPAKSGAGEKG